LEEHETAMTEFHKNRVLKSFGIPLCEITEQNDIVLLKYSFTSRPSDSPGTQWPCSI